MLDDFREVPEPKPNPDVVDMPDGERSNAYYERSEQVRAGLDPMNLDDVMVAIRHDLDPAWCDFIADIEHDPDHADRLLVEFVDGSTATITVEHTPA